MFHIPRLPLLFRCRHPWPNSHDDSSWKIRSWLRPLPPHFPRPTHWPPTRKHDKKSKKNRRRRRRATCCKWPSSAPAAAAASISPQFLANPHTEIAYIVDADEKIGQRRAEDDRQAAGQNAQVRSRPPQGARRQVGAHRLDRDPQSLARPVRDLGDAGRQGRLRGEAGEP